MDAEEQRIENEKKQTELKNAYGRLFKTDDGKEILKDLRSFCGQDRSSVCERSPNGMQTDYNEGKRRVILRINSMIKVKENKDA